MLRYAPFVRTHPVRIHPANACVKLVRCFTPRAYLLEVRQNILKWPDACNWQPCCGKVYPQSKVGTVAAATWRYWLIHFLDRGRYFGIEPAAFMLRKGIEHVLEPAAREEKQPRFDTNDRFDFSVFGEKFDVVLARSIWTHASKAQVQTMLDGFAANSSPEAFFLTSYLPASFWTMRTRDYQGDQWIGRSHQSSEPGLVYHSFGWIKEQVEARGMFVTQLPDLILNKQHWLRISRVGDQGQRASHKFRFA